MRGKAEQRMAHNECEENTKLSSSTQEQGFWVCNQRPKVRHNANTKENEGREDTQLYALIEVVKQATCCVKMLIERHAL